MPTKTKPKSAPSVSMMPVQLDDKQRRKITELLSVDRSGTVQNLAVAISAIEQRLTIHGNRLERLLDRPLPAHMVAAVTPIAKAAEELARLIHRDDLHLSVVREIPAIQTGEAWFVVNAIAVEATVARDRFKMQPSTGLHVREFADGLELAMDDFGALFDQLRPILASEREDHREGWRRDFLEFCRGKLPRGPTDPAPPGRPETAKRLKPRTATLKSRKGG